jgi:hypothetical protein
MKLSAIVKDKKGSMSETVMTSVVGIVIVAVLFMVTVPVMSSISTSITVNPVNSTGGSGGQAVNALYLAHQAVINNTGSALSISSIIPMVLAAGAIISALLVGLYVVFFKK